jgi:hypothetical protein
MRQIEKAGGKAAFATIVQRANELGLDVVLCPQRPQAGPPARPPRELVAWMNGERVGLWAISPTGTHTFTYAGSWRASRQSRPLSLYSRD